MELVRVNNTRPTLLHLPDKVETFKSEEGPRFTIIPSKSLMPGGNNVEKAVWDSAKKHHTVAQWIKIGWVTEGGDPAAPEGPVMPESLLDYGVPTSIAMVETENDTLLLGKWLNSDQRPEVTAALRRRLEAIGGGLKGPKK